MEQLTNGLNCCIVFCYYVMQFCFRKWSNCFLRAYCNESYDNG